VGGDRTSAAARGDHPAPPADGPRHPAAGPAVRGHRARSPLRGRHPAGLLTRRIHTATRRSTACSTSSRGRALRRAGRCSRISGGCRHRWWRPAGACSRRATRPEPLGFVRVVVPRPARQRGAGRPLGGQPQGRRPDPRPGRRPPAAARTPAPHAHPVCALTVAGTTVYVFRGVVAPLVASPRRARRWATAARCRCSPAARRAGRALARARRDHRAAGGHQRRAPGGLRSRERFLSIAAHELRTPLTSLALQLALIQRRIEQGADRETLRANAEALGGRRSGSRQLVGSCST
jgi:hypothetical protein